MFSTNSTDTTERAKLEKKKSESRHRCHILLRINTEWIIDLNVKYKPINVLEGNTDAHFGDLKFGVDFQVEHQKHNPKKKLISWTLLRKIYI